MYKLNVTIFLNIAILLITFNCEAQEQRIRRKGEFYISWGYNKEWYTKSNVKINQPGLGNNYKFANVKGHDHPGWDEGLFHQQLTIPQYNYRLGYFFNNKKDIGVEISFDHTKFIITDNQIVHIKGVLSNKNIDSNFVFSESNGFFYFLNNGANFFLFNLTKRWNLIQFKNVKISFLAKAGVGPVVPHVANRLFGKLNKPAFQLGGWNAAIDGAIRATFLRHVYLEFETRLDHARYSNLKIYEGTAKHAFSTAELILSLGYTFKQGGYLKNKK